MSTPEEILGAAMNLTEQERTQIALDLLGSVGPPGPLANFGDEEWVEEIGRRAASGKSSGTPWKDVRKRSERKLGV